MKLKVEVKNLSLKMERGEFNPPLEFSLEELACELEGEAKEIDNLIDALVGEGDSHES